MKTATTALIGLVIALGGCGGASDDVQSNEQSAQPKDRADVPIPMAQRDPTAYRGNVGSAMAEVPKDRQQDFQKLMACTIGKAAAAGKPVVVNADFTRALVVKLKTDPSAMLGCE